MQVEHQAARGNRRSVRRALLVKVLAVGGMLAVLAGTLAGDALAQYSRCRIAGFAHAFDVATVPICNYLGQCFHQPQQIPCQHPIWHCP
jgi:hypothetical protein